MTIDQAKNNIGSNFKVTAFGSGLLGEFDIIRTVDENGFIEGDFIIAHCEDCRLKQEVPAQFIKA